MRIGELAKITGAGKDTIRYYERIGLLPQPERADNLYKQYGPADVDRLMLIRKLQPLGFTLSEIRAMLEDRACNRVACTDVAPRVQAKLSELDRKIANLQSVRTRLRRAVQPCAGRPPHMECPALKGLAAK